MLGHPRRRQDSAATKLYVTNLSASATRADLRQLFGAAGEVLKVEFVTERSRGNAPSAAYVTMATAREAEAAIQKFHGRLFHDRSVMISPMPAAEGEPSEARKTKATATSVSISQQYREREGMVYELDCAGLQLTLRFSFQEDENSPRRVEATANRGREFVAEATGATRELALVAVASAWRELAGDPPPPELDWAEIMTALRMVRAV